MANPASLIGKGFESRPENIGSKPKGAVSRKTLFKRAYKEMLESGLSDPYVKLVRSMIEKGIAGDVSAANLVLDSICGKQKDSSTVEHKGKMSFAEMVVAADKKSKEPNEI